jgi:hypothetical protein
MGDYKASNSRTQCLRPYLTVNSAVRHVEEREDRMAQDCMMHWFKSL